LVQKALGHASILITAHICADLFEDELDALVMDSTVYEQDWRDLGGIARDGPCG